MRTTITLDPDTRLLVEQAMRERGLTFKQAVNAAIREGLGRDSEQRSYTTLWDMIQRHHRNFGAAVLQSPRLLVSEAPAASATSTRLRTH